MGVQWTKGAAGGYTAAGQKYSGQCGSRVRKNGSTGRTIS